MSPARPPELSLRPAVPADAEAICAIYNQGIEDRIATLETRLRAPQEQREWLVSRSARHPVIVAECNSHVIGWGSLNSFNARQAYDYVVDFSVYVERSRRGQGVGHQLLDRLTELARELGYHKLVLAMFPTNVTGLALYQRCGFRQVGVYREQGMLDGKWVDVLIMERIL